MCIEFMYDPTGGVQLGQGQGLGASGRPPSARPASAMARPTSALGRDKRHIWIYFLHI